MSTSVIPPITEAEILSSYLLPPSPLPTILPYSAFLSLVPNTYRNNLDYAPAIKRLYRDLQFQRDITLSQIQENIERECAGPAATLRASLARRIAIEEGEALDGIDGSRRKRRRVSSGDRGSESTTNESDDDGEHDRGIKTEAIDSSTEDDFDNPLRLQVQQAFYNDPSILHPAAHVLPLSADMFNDRMKLEGRSKYHTEESLLEAMENASESLDHEIMDLEAECERIKDAIKETVSGLSDLRYGKTNKRKDDNATEDGGEEYKEILDALAQFRETIKGNSRT